MLTLHLDQSGFDRIKRSLRDALPDTRSAHRTEAAARALGFGSNAALRAALADGPAKVPVNPRTFDDYLRSKGCRFAWSVFAAACAREAIRAVSAEEPMLGVDGYLDRNGLGPFTDYLTIQAKGPASLLTPLAVEGSSRHGCTS